MQRILAFLKSYRSEERGSLTVEAVLMMPLLFFAFIGTIVFFDPFRAQYLNQRATYTVADYVSRATIVDVRTMNNLHTILEVLSPTRSTAKLRVSVVCWEESRNRYVVSWSESRGGATRHNTATINTISDRLPPVPDRNEFILVETWMPQGVNYFINNADITFENSVFTKGREGGASGNLKFDLGNGRTRFRYCS